jgi:hypothetical protein
MVIVAGLIFGAGRDWMFGERTPSSQPSPSVADQKMAPSDRDALFTGRIRPKQIPEDWIGEPLPDGRGWRWSDPNDRSNAVRLLRGASEADDYVVVTVKGNVLDRSGKPTGQILND